jgi:glucose/arabinose dehydrogenase
MLHRASRPRLLVALALSALAVGLLFRAWNRVQEAGFAEPAGELPAALRERAPATAPSALPSDPAAGQVTLERVADGLVRPLFVTHAGDGSGRLFLVEQVGTIRVVRDGRLLAAPFLDLAAKLDTSDGERGLLGLAFAPDYPASGRFYVAHTATGRRGAVVRVARYRISADPDRADPASAATVLEMDDPASNHNGGMLAFGPDRMLWIGTGDGGRGGDPWDHARDRRSLLGKILRLDLATEPYAIPPDNPFARGGGAPEVWALGLRNPWRFSFDRATGELWIGDVGQNAWEEIHVEDPADGGGKHYGWRTMEGRHCFDPRTGCDPTGLELPVHEYGHDVGCSVTGGYVYRGRALPALAGAYLFADFCRGTVWSLHRDGTGTAVVTTLLETRFPVSSFGEDETGEVYVCDHGGGAVFRLTSR